MSHTKAGDKGRESSDELLQSSSSTGEKTLLFFFYNKYELDMLGVRVNPVGIMHGFNIIPVGLFVVPTGLSLNKYINKKF